MLLEVFVSPDIVVSTEDHATFCVARRADFAQLGLTAGALEASAVPVAVHGVQEEAVCDFAPTPCTAFPGQRTCAHWWWLAVASGIHHCPCKTQTEAMTLRVPSVGHVTPRKVQFILLLREYCCEHAGVRTSDGSLAMLATKEVNTIM